MKLIPLLPLIWKVFSLLLLFFLSAEVSAIRNAASLILLIHQAVQNVSGLSIHLHFY